MIQTTTPKQVTLSDGSIVRHRPPQDRQRLAAQYAPQSFDELTGQRKALRQLERLRKRGGLNGRAYWLAGKSGTGKSTIALLIGREVAGAACGIDEVDAGEISPDWLDKWRKRVSGRPLGADGWCLVVNEAHGLRAATVRRLLVMLEGRNGEGLPAHVTVVFTTTADGEQSLADGAAGADLKPLKDRCECLAMASNGLRPLFVERARAIAEIEGMIDAEMDKPKRWNEAIKTSNSSCRALLAMVESGHFEAE